VLDLVEVITQMWDRIMAESLRFLGFFVSSQKAILLDIRYLPDWHRQSKF